MRKVQVPHPSNELKEREQIHVRNPEVREPDRVTNPVAKQGIL